MNSADSMRPDVLDASAPAGGTVSFRPIRDADLGAITAIYGHHVLYGTASFETEPPLIEEMRRRQSELLSRGFPYLVAEEAGAVLGYAYAGTYRARPAYRGTVENSIYMRSDAIGKGIGKRLLKALISACEALDFRQMVAVVGDSSNAASIGLHEQCGFRYVGVLENVGYKHGRWLDTVLLQLMLGKGGDSPPLPPD